MKLTLERLKSDADATVGALYLDRRFFCFTLEDEYRQDKVPTETRVPAGKYKIRLRDEGGMTQRYANRFPDIHRGMLWLQDVPHFSYVYIHIGNTDEHTAGCILVGYGAQAARDNKSLQSSTDAYRDLYTKVAGAAESGDLTIDIKDRDR